MSRVRLILRVLVPFAAGYYLSYLFRSINAVIVGDLSTEPGLSPADLGALTSAYFLVFAAVVLPCGVLLDRYGPRLVDSALLLVAALGSLVFALADGVWTLMLGRALIGFGVCPRFDDRPQSNRPVVPPHRVALANGWFIMLGALGALSAAAPAEVLVQSVGWRGLFAILAAVSAAAVGLLILLVVPEQKQPRPANPTATQSIGFRAIFQDPSSISHLRRMSPIGTNSPSDAAAGFVWFRGEDQTSFSHGQTEDHDHC